jgi:aspartyl-tRNA(Asn)/glutamyl-tRNA(Gln) amidotransferase subunit A
MRPLQDYYDVRNVIALSELMSIHHREFVERTGDFSMDMLGRALPAALFQSFDYVEAQRERRLMVDEMKPLYERYDAFVTAASPAPAPRLDSHRTIGHWLRPNITTPFSISGSPALVLRNGFSASGLPLGLQIVARPFGEPMVFRVGHAFEQAAGFAGRKPQLSEAPAEPLVIDGTPDEPCRDEGTRSLVRVFARRAGLELGDRHLELLCQAAPHALAMTARIRRRRSHLEEPANVFRFDAPTR